MPKWEKLVERQADFWKNYMMISSIGDIKRVFGCSIRERLTTRQGMIFIHWINPKAVWNCSLQIEKKLRKRAFLPRVLKVFTRSQKILLAVNRKMAGTDYSKLSDKEVLQSYKVLCRAYKGLYAAFHLAVYVDSIEDKAKKWLKKELLRQGHVKNFENYFARLTAPNKPSLLQEEELALLDIVLEAKRKKLSRASIRKNIAKHQNMYAGLPVVNDQTKPWDEKYFSERFTRLMKKSFKQLAEDRKRLSNYPGNIRRDQDALFRNLPDPEYMKNFFTFIGLSTWIRLVSRNTFALSHFSSRRLFAEIACRKRITAEEVKWFTPQEVEILFQKGRFPSAEILDSRKEISVLLFRNNSHKVMVGDEARRFAKKELGKLVEIPKMRVLKGLVAYPGNVRGRARIVLAQKDIIKMKKGDIIVARMTTPEIIPAVKKAAAIVTDEGGVTCHAAIVSRELKIPCVVATKYATKILKDNELIYVNASQGLVERLKA